MEYDHEPNSPSFKSSPSSWIKSKAVDLPEEIKDKISSFFAKIVVGGGKSSRRSNNTSKFRYDPTSYALNFEDEAARINEWSFIARLPRSPVTSAVSRQMAVCN